MLTECVSPKKTGRCWCRCFPQDGSKQRGNRVRSSDCGVFHRLTCCCVCYCCMWQGVTRCGRRLCALSWRTGPTFRMSPCSNACTTARSGCVLCVSNYFGKPLRTDLKGPTGRTIRIVDGTIVREHGKTGSQCRILYSIRLPSLVCDFFEVTATIGEGSGESLNRLPVGPHELILADAGYCSIAGIEYVWQHGADVLIRVNPQSFVAYSGSGRRMSLLPRLRTLSKIGQFGEWRVGLHGQGSAFAGRLCAVRKSDCAIQQAHRRLQRRASKKQMITRPRTLEFAKYVIVFTTRSSGSTAEVLESYRMRWQIELVFKRMKSLAQLGHVPKHDDRSSRAWLYGKLLVTLLAQKLIRIGRDISPSGYPFSARRTI